MRLSRLLASGCALAAITPALLPITAASAASSERVVYVADRSGSDLLFGLYTTTNGFSDPNPTTVIAENGTVDVLQARLSPDGSLIAALVDSAGTGDYSLQVMNVDGGRRRTVFAATHNDTAHTARFLSGFSWAPDSSSLVFGPAVFTATTSSFKLSRYAVVGGAIADVPGSDGMEDPAVAPNGTIAGLDINDGLVVLDPATATTTPTTVAGNPPSSIVESPAWSADGHSLAYMRDTSTDTADQSSVEVITLSGSTWSAPTVVGPVNDGTHTWFSEYPTFDSDGTIWFDRFDDNTKVAPQDIVTASPPATAGGAWTLASNSTPADDGSITFGAIDTTAPGAPTLQPFTLAGTTTYVNWTGDPDVSKLNVHRTGSDGTTADFVLAAPFGDKTTKLGVTYTYTAKAIDGAGNAGAASSAPRSVTAEGVKLVVSNPTSLASAKLPFPVAWGVAGNKGATYTVQDIAAGGALKTFQSGTGATKATFSPTAGQTYSFRGLVRDGFGNSSAWTGWSKAVVPFDQSKGTFSSSPSWKTVKSTAYWLGSIKTTTHNKATATFKLTSRGVQIIGDKLPAGAKFAVYVGKSYKGTFTTHAATTKHRQVLCSLNFSSLATRTIKIVAVVASGKTLKIDGVAAPK